MRTLIVLVMVLAVCVAGCVYIDGPTTTLIDQSATLSKQVATNAAGRSDVPASLQSYLQSDATSWQAFSDTAHGKATVAK